MVNGLTLFAGFQTRSVVRWWDYKYTVARGGVNNTPSVVFFNGQTKKKIS